MIRIFAIIIALILLAILINYFVRSTADKRIKIVKVILFVMLVVVLTGLVLAGRLNWLAAAFGSLIPLLPRILSWFLRHATTIIPLLSRLRSSRQGAVDSNVHGQQSVINTSYLSMTLDHDTGGMIGRIIKGQFQGRLLSELSIQEIRLLINECDDETESLLMAYLDRYHRRNTDDVHRKENKGEPEFMSIHEAREILGVKENAKEEEIKEAHRQLIHKLHPDRGGSEYLSAKINRAKDVLISAL